MQRIFISRCFNIGHFFIKIVLSLSGIQSRAVICYWPSPAQSLLLSGPSGAHDNIVTYLLKARNVEPEKQPLLADGSEIIFVSRQTKERLGKHVTAATDSHATENVFYVVRAEML
jgi:hypothetical protein